MIQYLIQSLLIALTISLCCVAIHVSTWQGMILHSVSISVEKVLAKTFNKVLWLSVPKATELSLYLLKPVFRCMICMSSIWTVLFWLFWDFNLVLIMLCVCGINTLFTALISNILPDE